MRGNWRGLGRTDEIKRFPRGRFEDTQGLRVGGKSWCRGAHRLYEATIWIKIGMRRAGGVRRPRSCVVKQAETCERGEGRPELDRTETARLRPDQTDGTDRWLRRRREKIFQWAL